ncbi:LYER [Mytilus edulis]|uniref:LYER n=1 Tax=Mytilus edulis TaxID=6550 RepID=A0A8S3SJ90_MYTED|nr:LYER [Mytilus edulis]
MNTIIISSKSVTRKQKQAFPCFELLEVEMVVFTCSQCNESLKKNQVEKHFQTRCRNCNMISCVDCGKDFWGDSYAEHIKCISEEEKYSGRIINQKANANKGEVKQEQWLEKVQVAIDKCITNPRLKGVLERMKDYPNIPRKKAKFEETEKLENKQDMLTQEIERLQQEKEQLEEIVKIHRTVCPKLR